MELEVKQLVLRILRRLLSQRSSGFEGRGLSTEMFEHRNKEQLAPWDFFQEEGQQRKQQKECRKYQGWHFAGGVK